MSVTARQESLSTTAELVLTATQLKWANVTRPIQVFLRNDDAAIAMFVGPSTVTNAGANGYRLAPAGGTLLINITSPDELLYIVAASGTPVVSILAVGPVGE